LETIILQSLNQDAATYFDIQRPDIILALYKYLALNNGMEASLQTLSSKIGISVATVRKYLDTLEMLGLIYIIANTLDPLKKINTKPKIYVNSMFNLSFGTPKINNLGLAVESYVLERLIASKKQICFFRERDSEIDFVDLNNKKLYEVKFRQEIEPKDYQFLQKKASIIGFDPVVISQTKTSNNPNFQFIPACWF
jgi:predicted AAA+ superfamily ATPase